MARPRGRPPKINRLADDLFGVVVGGQRFIVKVEARVISPYPGEMMIEAERAKQTVMEEVLGGGINTTTVYSG